jgi:hypothetical protein
MKRNPLKRSQLQSPINSPKFLRTFIFNRPPTTSDYKNFKVSDLWIHNSPGEETKYGYYVLVDKPNKSAVWIDLSASQLDDIQKITGDEGSDIKPDFEGNVNIIGGSEVTTSGEGNTLTIEVDPSPYLTWEVNTTTPIDVEIEKCYIANASEVITYNMPETAKLGDEFAFYDLGGNGFIIQGQSGQTIRLGNQVTSSERKVTSSEIGDVIWLVCAVENTTFLGYSSQGNFTLS